MNIRSVIELSFKGLYYFFTNKNFRTFLYLLIRYGNKNKRFLEKNIRVNNLKLTIPDALSFVWQYYEIFYKEYYDFNSDKNSPRIIDCGANVGISCLYYLTKFPEASVTAFEANPEIAKHLRNNLKANAGNSVEVIEKAVWTEDGTLNFTEDSSDSGSISNSGSLIVKSIRLKDYLQKEVEVDFLKIDIEGAEVQVLNDIKDELVKVKNCFIEYHSYTDGSQDLAGILSILESNGFRYYMENARIQDNPFQGVKVSSGMDLQMNIFAWKAN